MAEQRLKDKVSIVSGAGTRGPMPGTGQATAILYARHGAKVLLTDFDLVRAEETQASIAAEGGTASRFPGRCDQRGRLPWHDRNLCRALWRAACLVQQRWRIGSGMVTEIEEEYLDRAIAVNLKSAILTSKHAIPAMIDSGGGSIINVSSIDGLRAGFSRKCALLGRESRYRSINTRYRCASWPRQYPRELYRARPSICPVRGQYQQRKARIAAQGRSAGHGRRCLGCRLGRPVPGE